MTRLEKFLHARDVIGWTCDKQGNVFGKKGQKIGNINFSGYYVSAIRINKKIYKIFLHQFIFWYFNNTIPKCIDHINNKRNDNSLSNLRGVCIQENQFNRIGVKGYYFDKQNNKYRSYICFNYKLITLGHFDSEIQARNAYLKAKEKLHKYKPTN